MSFIRFTLERLARLPLFKYWRRLPAPFSDILLYVTPDASLRYLKPGTSAFTPDLLQFAHAFVKPDSCVWDIGANIGLFTFPAALMAGRNGQVVSFEPDPTLISLLHKTKTRQPANSALVTIVEAAVASRCEELEFQIAGRGRAANALVSAVGSTQMGGVRKVIRVQSVTMDDMLECHRAPQLVKLDIEGAELQALQGATKLLRTIRPTIYCELGLDGRSVLQLLLDADYKLFNPSCAGNGAEPLDFDSCTGLANILALPAEATKQDGV